jgi:glycosyltransferase involved in cell wall biosynthesis
MLSGLPVISYNSPHGPGTIIQDQIDGFLVTLNDKEEFIRLISLLISDRELRNKMAQKGRENVLRFETKEVMKEWDKLFSELNLSTK